MERSRRDLADGGVSRTLDRDFVMDVLHELRSPLTVVDGRVFQLRQQLRTGDADPATIAARLDEIDKAAHLMAAALESLAARLARAAA